MGRRFILLFVLIFTASFLTGCKEEGIAIKPHSSAMIFEQNLQESQKPKSIVKNSSGIIIYKDISSQTEVNSAGKINFGPRDVNFDLPVNIK